MLQYLVQVEKLEIFADGPDHQILLIENQVKLLDQLFVLGNKLSNLGQSVIIIRQPVDMDSLVIGVEDQIVFGDAYLGLSNLALESHDIAQVGAIEKHLQRQVLNHNIFVGTLKVRYLSLVTSLLALHQ